MAIMIPSIPKSYTPESDEEKVFYALKKLPGSLSDKDKDNAYYVFHSYEINQVNQETNEYEQNEIDFLIFHPKKESYALSVKAAKIKKENKVEKLL